MPGAMPGVECQYLDRPGQYLPYRYRRGSRAGLVSLPPPSHNCGLPLAERCSPPPGKSSPLPTGTAFTPPSRQKSVSPLCQVVPACLPALSLTPPTTEPPGGRGSLLLAMFGTPPSPWVPVHDDPVRPSGRRHPNHAHPSRPIHAPHLTSPHYRLDY